MDGVALLTKLDEQLKLKQQELQLLRSKTQHASLEAEALDTQLSSVQDAINTKQRVVDSLHATMAAHQRALDQQHEAMEGLQVQLGDALHHGRQAAQRRRAALAEAAALLHRITDTMLEYTTS